MLKGDKLTLTKAIAMARAWECSKKEAKELEGEVNTAIAKLQVRSKEVVSRNSLTHSALSDELFDCKQYGSCHGWQACPAFGKKCEYCGGLNHFEVSCYKKK